MIEWLLNSSGPVKSLVDRYDPGFIRSTITALGIIGSGVQNFLVMRRNMSFYVLGTGVADLYTVSVDKLVKFMGFWKVFVNQT